MPKTIGIVGGMGPLAGADLLTKIIKLTKASADQEHLHVILDSYSAIPDRTAAILHGGPDPMPALLESCRRLEGAGAEILLFACNTAHYYYEQLQPHLRGCALHMPRETALAAKEAGYRKIALLATDGTVLSGVYGRELQRAGVALLLPEPEEQACIMSLIYDFIKAGRTDWPEAPVRALLARLVRAGAEAFVLGCTELPLVFSHSGLGAPALDPTEILAKKAIIAAGAMLVA